MSSTSYVSTGAYLDTGIGICRIHGQIVYTVSRSDNTLTWTNTYSQIKYVRESGSWSSFTYGSGWTQKLYLASSSTNRDTETDSGTRAVNATDKGTTVSFTSSVTASQTTVTGKVGAYFAGDSQTNTSTFTIGIPSLGSPTIDTNSVTGITTTGATINWTSSNGTNGTFSSMKLDYGLTTSYGTTVTGLSADSSTVLTGLQPGTTYHAKLTITNGGGKTGNSGDFTFTTLSVPSVLPVLLGL